MVPFYHIVSASLVSAEPLNTLPSRHRDEWDKVFALSLTRYKLIWITYIYQGGGEN